MWWWQQLLVDAVHFFRNLPQASQGAPNDTGKVDDRFSAAPTVLGSFSLTFGGRPSPGFPVELSGLGKVHAPFLTERRTRGPVLCYVAGNPASLGMTKGRVVLSLDVVVATTACRRVSQAPRLTSSHTS
jgi:hypothetical protein